TIRADSRSFIDRSRPTRAGAESRTAGMKLGGGPPAAPPVTGGAGDESDAGDGPPAAAPPVGGAGGRTDPYGVIGAAAPPPGTPVADAGAPIDEPDAGAANGPGPILADAGAADTDVVAAPAGRKPNGVDGVWGTGCAGVTGTPPAALAAPAAKLRPNSPPTADDIARAEACCTAAGFAALPAEPANPLAELPAGLPPPSSPDNGPIPPLAALLSGELPPPLVDGSGGTCGNEGRVWPGDGAATGGSTRPRETGATGVPSAPVLGALPPTSLFGWRPRIGCDPSP